MPKPPHNRRYRCKLCHKPVRVRYRFTYRAGEEWVPFRHKTPEGHQCPGWLDPAEEVA